MIRVTLIEICEDEYKEVIWKDEEYTEYKYDGKCFIIIKEQQWVGIYNMDNVVSVVISPVSSK